MSRQGGHTVSRLITHPHNHRMPGPPRQRAGTALGGPALPWICGWLAEALALELIAAASACRFAGFLSLGLTSCESFNAIAQLLALLCFQRRH